jgi:hypothetical protein
MEARQTFSGTSVSRGLMVVVAIAVTAGIAAIGALATKDLGGSQANVKSTVQAPAALPLRQDNDYPVLNQPALTDRGAEQGFVQTHDGRRGGTIDSAGAGATADGNGPDSDLTRVLPGSAPSGYNPGWDARSVREGHGP